ncbi:MAG: hypothetical protein ACI38Q_04955 [Candidatus Bruticola sp.]
MNLNSKMCLNFTRISLILLLVGGVACMSSGCGDDVTHNHYTTGSSASTDTPGGGSRSSTDDPGSGSQDPSQVWGRTVFISIATDTLPSEAVTAQYTYSDS